MHLVKRFSSHEVSRERFRLSTSRDWQRRAATPRRRRRGGVTFSTQLTSPIYLSLLGVSERIALPSYRARLMGRRPAPVGCLISHLMDTVFIARLTISDSARPKSRNKRKCDDRADKGPLDKCSETGARIDIGSAGRDIRPR